MKWKRCWCDALSLSPGSRDGPWTPKVLRPQAAKSILSSIQRIRTKRRQDPPAVFRPTFQDGLQDAIRIDSPNASGGQVLGPARSFATGHQCCWRKSSYLHSTRRESVGHGPVQISSVPLTWETRFEIRDVDRQTDFSIHFKQGRWTLQFPRTVAVGTRPSVPSLG